MIEADAGPGLAYTDRTVAAEASYVYRVKAVSPTGVSQWSGYADADTPAAPQPTPTPEPESLAPSGLSAGPAGGGGVVLTWDAPEEDAGSVTGYEVLRAQGEAELTTLAADTGSADTAYTDDTATEPGETYAYRVRALRGGERSQASNRAAAFIPKTTRVDGNPPVAAQQSAAGTRREIWSAKLTAKPSSLTADNDVGYGSYFTGSDLSEPTFTHGSNTYTVRLLLTNPVPTLTGGTAIYLEFGFGFSDPVLTRGQVDTWILEVDGTEFPFRTSYIVSSVFYQWRPPSYALWPDGAILDVSIAVINVAATE